MEVTPPRDQRWLTAGSDVAFATAIVWRGDRVSAAPRKLGAIGDSSREVVPVSRNGTLAIVDVKLSDGPVTLVSAYAFWERPHGAKDRQIFADASAHRLISDISGLLESNHRHRIIVAGDFNIFNGHSDRGSLYWKERYASVFTRFAALGLPFVGPQFPDCGRQADPWPANLPPDSLNVPTFYSNRQTRQTATWQLDFVFASRSIANRIRTRALNGVDEWGPSDHCRVEILVDD